MRWRRCILTAAIFALLALLALASAPAVASAAAPSSSSFARPSPPPAPRASQGPAAHAPQEPGAQAEEHAEEEEHAAEPRAWWYWPSKWFNFIALLGFLYWVLVVPPPAIQEIFSFPGLRVVFAERAAAVIAARELAAEEKQEASRLLTESEQRLTKIEDEVAALVAGARTDAEREQERALQDGKAQAEKIHQVAQREIKHHSVGAHRQLRGYVADLAVSMAEKSLAEHLTADDQDRLIREYLTRLSQNMA